MSSFDSNGNYNKTNWKTGDKITADKLNKIEESLEIINNNDIERHKETDERLDELEQNEKVIEEELNNKATKEHTHDEYLTEHQDISHLATKEELNQGKADMEAMVAEVEADLEGLHAKDEEISEQLAHKAYKTYVTPYEFGAIKNSDSTQSFIEMINYANKNKLPIMIPKHNFIISDTLPLSSNLTIYGDNGINSIDDNYHIKYTGDNYLFESNKTMSNIEFKDLVIHGGNKEEYINSCMKITCQRFKLSNCSIMYFKNCLVLNAIDQNVVENIIQNNLIQFCEVGIDIPQNSNTFLYSDGIIHNNFIATYKTVGISGYMAQFKITNNQIYTSHLTSRADILFGGFANYINNNNFGGKTINLMYDNVLYKGNLDENIITNNIFLNQPKENNDLYCIVIKTDTVAKLLISNNIFGCQRFESDTIGKIYAVYCKGVGYQNSQIINNQGYLYKHIGGDEDSRVSDLYIIGYDRETNAYRIGTNNTNEKILIGKKFEVASYGGVPPTETNGNVGKIISDVNAGNLYISRGPYGMQRCITTVANGKIANIDMTSANKIRYTTNITSQYPVGDLIINPETGDIYISKGSDGNKKLSLED